MVVADMMKPDGHVFLKSEWGPLTDYWPAVSFTKRSVGIELSQRFRPGRDILIYVGTTGENTGDPTHRSRLLSAIVPEPNRIHETKRIIPPHSWAASVDRHGDRWPHSLAVIKGASFADSPLPYARQVIPRAYASFAETKNRGRFVEAYDEERQAVMALSVEPSTLNLAPDVLSYLKMRAAVSVEIPRTVREEVLRIAQRVINRVKSGGEPVVRINPMRTAPNLSDLVALFTRLWQEKQGGFCPLCGAVLHAMTTNKMMQASADRIDSANGSYAEGNVHITHLACNLAKNMYGMDDFEEWISALRGVDLSYDK